MGKLHLTCIKSESGHTNFLLLSEEELAPYVESVIDQAEGGPFVLGNSDSCPPGVTIEKFKLVAQIAKSRKWRGADRI